MNEILTIALSITLSLSGIIFGMILSLISPEEMLPGKKYFVLLKRILFVIVSSFIIFSLLGNIYAGLSFLALLAVLFILDFRFNKRLFYVIHYLLFFTSYFLISQQSKLILASLIFLYGFPLGTLLRTENEK